MKLLDGCKLFLCRAFTFNLYITMYTYIILKLDTQLIQAKIGLCCPETRFLSKCCFISSVISKFIFHLLLGDKRENVLP